MTPTPISGLMKSRLELVGTAVIYAWEKKRSYLEISRLAGEIFGQKVGEGEILELTEFAYLAGESALNKLLGIAALDHIALACRQTHHLVEEVLDSILEPPERPVSVAGGRDARG